MIKVIKINKLYLSFVCDNETKVPRVSSMGETFFVIEEKVAFKLRFEQIEAGRLKEGQNKHTG